MKIWKVKEYTAEISRTISLVPKQRGTERFWEGIKTKILRNTNLAYDEFAALYYAVALARTAAIYNEPSVLVIPLEEPGILDKVDKFERTLPSKSYENILQNMYITIALDKPNGKEFCEGSLRFTGEEYKERHALIMQEITDMKLVAEKYLYNLDKMIV